MQTTYGAEEYRTCSHHPLFTFTNTVKIILLSWYIHMISEMTIQTDKSLKLTRTEHMSVFLIHLNVTQIMGVMFTLKSKINE